MIKSTIFLLLLLMIIPVTVQAEDELPDPGITPDNFLYPFDVFFDDVSLIFTFDEEAKFNKSLQILNERLAEIVAMNNTNNTQGIEKAIEQHKRIMEKMQVRMNVSDNATENLKLQLQLEEKMRIHEEKVLHVSTKLVPEKQGLMNSILNNTCSIKEDIQQEKNKFMKEINNSGHVESNLKTELGINNIGNISCNKKPFQNSK